MSFIQLEIHIEYNKLDYYHTSPLFPLSVVANISPVLTIIFRDSQLAHSDSVWLFGHSVAQSVAQNATSYKQQEELLAEKVRALYMCGLVATYICEIIYMKLYTRIVKSHVRMKTQGAARRGASRTLRATPCDVVSCLRSYCRLQKEEKWASKRSHSPIRIPWKSANCTFSKFSPFIKFADIRVPNESAEPTYLLNLLYMSIFVVLWMLLHEM